MATGLDMSRLSTEVCERDERLLPFIDSVSFDHENALLGVFLGVVLALSGVVLLLM